jgi:hypothetical protein
LFRRGTAVLARLVVEDAVEGVAEVWDGQAVLRELKSGRLVVGDGRSTRRRSRRLGARALRVLALARHGLMRSAAERLSEWRTRAAVQAALKAHNGGRAGARRWRRREARWGRSGGKYLRLP